MAAGVYPRAESLLPLFILTAQVRNGINSLGALPSAAPLRAATA